MSDCSGVTGLDRMQLLQPKETRNIRFDFRTDDLEFHTSEEEYDEELEEEGDEEEEEEYEDEEEYDSEAGDPVSSKFCSLRVKQLRTSLYREINIAASAYLVLKRP